MKFSFRRRHWVLVASLLSTGALGLGWADNADVDLWQAVDWLADDAIDDAADESQMALHELQELPVLNARNPFATGFIPYEASDSAVARKADADKPEEPLELEFEATGAGYSGGGMARFLGALPHGSFGIIRAGAASLMSPQLASMPSTAYAMISPRKSIVDSIDEEDADSESQANTGGDSETVITGGSDQQGSNENSDESNKSGDTVADGSLDGTKSSESGSDPLKEVTQGNDQQAVEVDEPATWVLLGIGLAGLTRLPRRATKQQA